MTTQAQLDSAQAELREASGVAEAARSKHDQVGVPHQLGVRTFHTCISSSRYFVYHHPSSCFSSARYVPTSSPHLIPGPAFTHRRLLGHRAPGLDGLRPPCPGRAAAAGTLSVRSGPRAGGWTHMEKGGRPFHPPRALPQVKDHPILSNP